VPYLASLSDHIFEAACRHQKKCVALIEPMPLPGSPS